MSKKEHADVQEADMQIDAKLLEKTQKEVAKESSHIANMLPWMDENEIRGLVWSILTGGFDPKRPIRRVGGRIWDGRNREVAVRVINAMEQAKAQVEGRDPKYVVAKYEDKDHIADADILRTVIQDNLNRRSITSGQRAAILVKSGALAETAARVRNATPEEKLAAKEFGGEIAKYLGAQHGTNVQYVYMCKRMVSEGRAELLDLIISRELSVTDAMGKLKGETAPDAKDVPKPKNAKKKADGETGPEPAGDAATAADGEPEKAPVTDAFGKVVPPEWVKVFAVRYEVENMIDRCRRVRDSFRAACLTEGGEIMKANGRETMGYMKAFCDRVRSDCPHSICPVCEGTGVEETKDKKKTCPACGGHKWFTHEKFALYEKYGITDPDAGATDGKADEKAEKPAEKPKAKRKPSKKAAEPEPEYAPEPAAYNPEDGEPEPPEAVAEPELEPVEA